jgi:hypothetical protein
MLRVFEKSVLSKMLESERDEVPADWRRQHNVELYDLYSLRNNSRVINSRIRWPGNVALIGDRRKLHPGFWWGNIREIYHLEDPGVDRRIIIKRIFKKWNGDMDWIGMAQDSSRWGSYECGDERAGSIQSGEFLD